MTINKFWHTLQVDEQTICQHPLYKMVELVNQILHKDFAHLNIDIIAGKTKTYALMLSAQDDFRYFEDIISLWHTAPLLEHFEVLPFRQPTKLLNKLEITIDNQHIVLTNEDILLTIAEQQRGIALTVSINKEIPQSMMNHAKALAVMLLSHYLGEYEFATRVNNIKFTSLSKQTSATKLSDFSAVFESFWQNTLAHSGEYPTQDWQWTTVEIPYQHDDVSDVAIITRNESANSLVSNIDFCYRLELAARVDDKTTMDAIFELEKQINDVLLTNQDTIYCQALYTDAVRYMTWYVKYPQQAFQLADKVRQKFAILDTELITDFDPTWSDYLHWVNQ